MLINDDNKKSEEYAEIYQVAHMYYDLNMLQSDIADKLFLSRPKVSRLLNQAKELGIVEIKVHPVIDRLPSLEKKLCDLFGLQDAIVISSHPDRLENMEEALIKYSSQYVGQKIKKGGIIGISKSRTVNAILDQLKLDDQYPLEIVQQMGTTVNSLSMQDTTLILTRLAQHHSNLTFHALSTSLYVNDLYLKEVILREPAVHAVFEKMTRCTLMLTGLSAPEKRSNVHNSWQGLMNAHHIEEHTDLKAAGCMLAQYYNINGIKLPSEWNAKVIAMNLNSLSVIPTRIGVAQGLDKIRPIYGGLKGKLLNVIITDSNTASDVISLADKRNAAKAARDGLK